MPNPEKAQRPEAPTAHRGTEKTAPRQDVNGTAVPLKPYRGTVFSTLRAVAPTPWDTQKGSAEKKIFINFKFQSNAVCH